MANDEVMLYIDSYVNFGIADIDMDLFHFWMNNKSVDESLAIWCDGENGVFNSDTESLEEYYSNSISASLMGLTIGSENVYSDPADNEEKRFKRHLRCYIAHNFAIFEQISKYLRRPNLLQVQNVIQIPSFLCSMLISHYYSFDHGIMREILNRNKTICTHKAKERDFKKHSCLKKHHMTDAVLKEAIGDLNCELTGVAGAVLQYNNVRSMIKSLCFSKDSAKVREIGREKSLAQLLLNDFALPQTLAKEYSAIIFLCYFHMELKKGALSTIQYQPIADSSRCILNTWMMTSRKSASVQASRESPDDIINSTSARDNPRKKTKRRSLSDIDDISTIAMASSFGLKLMSLEKPFLSLENGPDLILDKDFFLSLKNLKFILLKPPMEDLRSEILSRVDTTEQEKLLKPLKAFLKNSTFSDLLMNIVKIATTLSNPKKFSLLLVDIMDTIVVPLKNYAIFSDAHTLESFFKVFAISIEELNDFRINNMGSGLGDSWRRYISTVANCVQLLYFVETETGPQTGIESKDLIV